MVLTANLSDKLVNGLRGVVVAMDQQGPTISFSALEHDVKVTKHNFSVFSVTKMCDTAWRRQLPLTLGFALTVHRAQGLTIDRIVIDCRNMHTPGQIGVAVGRARSKKGLRVINFNEKLLKQHDPSVLDFYNRAPLTTCSCLNATVSLSLSIEFTDTQEGGSSQDNNDQQQQTEECHDEIFDVETDEIEPLAEELLGEIIETCITFQCPQLQSTLDGLSHLSPQTEEQIKENDVVLYLQQESENKTRQFAEQIWQEIAESFKKIDKSSVAHSDIRNFYCRDYTFMSSAKYMDLVERLYQRKPEREHSNVTFKLCCAIRREYVREQVQETLDAAKENSATSTASAFKQSDAGRGTQRYIGGWCIATLKHHTKQFIRRNLYSSSRADEVAMKNVYVQYLEHLETSIHDLLLTSHDPASLETTQRKQNISGSLTNITDAAYEFFMYLDNTIRALESQSNVYLHGTTFYQYVSQEIQQHQMLFLHWKNLFDLLDTNSVILEAGTSEHALKHPTLVSLLEDGTSKKTNSLHDKVVQDLFKEACCKFIRMSCGQFRRQFIREVKADKQEAHRKQIRIRSTKKTARTQPFSFDTFVSDTSDKKIVSHRLLQSKFEGDPTCLSSNKFKKCHILVLCAAYDVKAAKSATMAKLQEKLAPHVLNSAHIAYPDRISDSEPVPPKKSKPNLEEIALEEANHSVALCGICNFVCEEQSIQCNLCNIWYHYLCVGLNDESVVTIGESDWHCPMCYGLQ